MDAEVFLRNEYLRTAFDMFDKDKSGTIDVNEIMQMIGEEGMDETVTREKL
jgi:Ca2+-binding EF-hand superfamily protein